MWQRHYNVGSAEINDDPDGDGFVNWEEERWGTDPNDSDSIPELRLEIGEEVVAIANPPVGKRVRIRKTTDLVSWVDAGGVLVGIGEPVRVPVGGTGVMDKGFFRSLLCRTGTAMGIC